jgi:hypothetical protein
MNYKLYLIVFLTLVCLSLSAFAQDKRYRIEIIVLSHLQHDAVPLETDWLRDFSEATDFLYVPEVDEDDEEANGATADAEEATADSGSAEPGALVDVSGTELLPGAELLPGEEAEPDPLMAVVHIETMSEVMQESWRRLRLSGPFRPEQYLSWEQGADEPFPLLRIHNEEIVLLDDPWADLRAEPEEDADAAAAEAEEPIVFSDQGSILPGEPEPAEEVELPEPTRFHQIDGTVMLKRTRFLHLDLDLELREAVFDEMALTRALILQEEGDGQEESEDGELEIPQPSSFLTHSLKQSRQVKSQRMEYFDGPVLSVLAYITRVEVEQLLDQDGNPVTN